jgi:hypothetical protein
LTFTWINPSPIEKGEFIAPARILGEASRKFAAFHLIRNDFRYASECFKEAEKIGVPSATNTLSKALIFSGVVAYARPFKTGVREVKLDPETFSALAAFNIELHQFLIAVRDKHVAHSVNEFESCEAVAAVIGTPQAGWRDGSGVGVAITQVIGLSLAIVRDAISQTAAMTDFLTDQIENQRRNLYEQFRTKFAADGKWEIAPIARLPNRRNVSRRR